MAASVGGEEPQDDAVTTRPDIEVIEDPRATELRARARRVRERSQELIDELGIDHPMVAAALDRADAMERQADRPGEIRLD